ncbi:GTPase activating protein GYP1 [Histoplasma capsulatum var. duboisii H88]|uniref:GTPase activating protein GYP1 n=1 Tax=Ajellomyces capsulatus (strain H88) TaxID=544711 RepID=A0A8A1LUX0_AJEC8|nr:GTPase activating protein GYP1 [Histoplasma capsulatum var. duboisii H88]
MASRKTAQQEMVQVDQTDRIAPPFWKTRSPPPQQPKPHGAIDPNTVIGASYSHADMVRTTSPYTRQHVSPMLPRSSNNSRSSSSAHLTEPGGSTLPNRQPYASLMAQVGEDWSHDDDGFEDELLYDDDEDEFGLPSVTKMRKNAPARPQRQLGVSDERGGSKSRSNGSSALKCNLSPTRLRANSSDIAEERGILSYPTAKKTDGKILRPQYKEILTDPANSLHLINHSPPPTNGTPKQLEGHSSRISRINKFKRILQASTVSLPELRDLAWSGVPDEVRAMTWQLLLGYLPTNSERRVTALERKRKEYLDGVRQAFERGNSTVDRPSGAGSTSDGGTGRGLDEAIWHQISIDIPRTNPHIPLYGYEATQRSLERILYVWAIRHPASGYVQGINDLVTPFWQVFLGTYITDLNIEEGMDPGQLPKAVLDAVEADSFWCLTKLLDGIQDNYIYAQPGIHRQVRALRDLTMRIDSTLAKHLEQESVEFMQFSFRWMNCLLMREVSIQNTIRMWDTYMAEEQGFSRFHLYVCAAFLVKWSDQLLKMDFQEIMMFLQSLPTKDWTEKDIELLLSEAFIWQSLFQDSSAHLRSSAGTPSGPG